MKVTIVGGGNVGTQFAVHFSQENDVYIYTSKPEEYISSIELVDENDNNILTGKNIKATNDSKIAFENSDLIFITYPAFEMENAAKIIYPYVKEGTKIGLIPGTGGGECAFKQCIDKGAIIFGMQRVPSVARIVERGKKVKAVGYRNELSVASLPSKYCDEIANIIEKTFKIKCKSLPNYLNNTLTPSNPILHTTRLRTIFKNYKDGVVYDSLPLFYEGWNDETSDLLLKCDEEVQNICKALANFDLKNVKSLKEHYESNNSKELTHKIKSITGFKGLTTPSVKTANGYIPDLNSRYFTADFPYGLSILIQIGKMLGVSVKSMEETMDWYKKISNNKNEYNFKKYEINNKDDFINFYSR